LYFLISLSNIMSKKEIVLLPKHQRILAQLGENLCLARLRRRLSAEQVAERAGISRSTLHQMESGAAGTSLGKLLQVMVVMGLEADIGRLAADDMFGRRLEDARLTETRKRAPKRTKDRNL
jgi:transcriptional regulator with XRE-family HTH domain